ncbi:hypothetical protein LOZ58_004991 [Ophidiomyces ophidiicola]|nr:hypothetical protein LOZ65_002098 [Ophidiomyces ophidiicola]KAI1935418.1 hypothetical protein LOZ66_005305 [Ophidiomyces ophidiicola]KAI1958585.1 hypothetical protein LOZ58_004991 [Ophidiomyces ophidiicola]
MRRQNNRSTSPRSGTFPRIAGNSAFSEHAHPDEDWTQISDLTERRRIQNRIAQRNYRKKLKQRMEEERSADESDAFKLSPEQRPLRSQTKAEEAQHAMNSTTPLGTHSTYTSSMPNDGHIGPHQSQYNPSCPPELSPSPFYAEPYTYSQYQTELSQYLRPRPESQHGVSSSEHLGASRELPLNPEVGHFIDYRNYCQFISDANIPVTEPLYQQAGSQPSMPENYAYQHYDPNSYPYSTSSSHSGQKHYRRS